MTILPATVTRSADSGSVLAWLTAALQGYATDYWPPHVAAPQPSAGAPVLRAWAAAPARLIAAAVAAAYSDDYYHRIHMRPANIDLGNLVSAQTRTVEVWNAWYDQALTLTALQADDADGIAVTGQPVAPLGFSPLQARTWSINIEQTGPSAIDALLSLLFSNGEAMRLAITGKRVVAWMVPADWVDGLIETLAWLTDVQQAENGNQVREPLRSAPRRAFKFKVLARGQPRRVLESALYAWGARSWAMPVWPDVTWLTAAVPAGSSSLALDTAELDYVVGGLAMLYHDAAHAEIVEVSDVQPGLLGFARPTVGGYGPGDRIYPCRIAQLAEAQTVSRRSDDVIAANVSLQVLEPCDATPVAPAATYLGLPVFEAPDDWAKDHDVSYARQLTITDNSLGVPDTLDRSDKVWLTRPQAWLLSGRTERGDLRRLLYWLQGRAQALWVPSGAADLRMAAVLVASSTTLTVEWCGYTRYVAGQPGRRHVRIELYSGAVYYRRITASTESTDTEQLGLDTALGITVAPDDVCLISYLVLSTLASDSVEISHDTDSMGLARCTVGFMAVGAEEPA